MKLSDRQKQTVENLDSMHSDNDYFWDEKTGIAKFAKGKLSKPSDENPEKIARKFIDDNPGLLDLQSGLNETLEVIDIDTDVQGFHHVYLAQSLNGIPVYEGSTQVHINPNGEVVAYKDYRLAACDISTSPRIDEKQAIVLLCENNALAADEIADSKQRLVLFRDDNKELHLVWEIEWIRSDEVAPSCQLIDAQTGNTLFKHSHFREALSRMTYTAKNTSNLKAELLAKDDQASTDHVVQAAHDNAKIVYEYFLNTFGRDSYDSRGSKLVSTVHFKKNYNNAYWTDYYEQMVYGDGDGRIFAPLSLALDVVGHELTHAVTSRTARFVYAEEAGALDESFADFFGIMVTNEGEISDWKMGEGVYTPFRSGDALRDVSEPTRHGQPDHMDDFLALDPGEQPDGDKNDHGYVHSNSGIPNKASYLTVSGGTHHGITVEGIGREKTEQIYYLALTSYLYSTTDSRWTFMQARYALLNACRQLYGDTGNEYATVKNAWAAVGVGEPAESFGLLRKQSAPYLAIPDNNPTGIKSIIPVDDEGLIKTISVSLDIQHSYRGDLRVILISPAGEQAVLHDREGRSSPDIVKTYNLSITPELNTFIGDNVKGDWTLWVTDNARIDTGKLRTWMLEFSVHKAEKKEFNKTVAPAESIPDNDPAGIESTITTNKSGKIVRLDVSVDISHTWIGDLVVTLVSPAGTEIILHNKTGRSRHDIKTVYSTTSDDSMQAFIGEELKGDWRLFVVDTYRDDVGTLNEWGLNCVFE